MSVSYFLLLTLFASLFKVVDSVKTDEKTRNDIAERLIEYHADTIATATKASTIMGTGHLDVSPPVKVGRGIYESVTQLIIMIEYEFSIYVSSDCKIQLKMKEKSERLRETFNRH